ncbi:MAG: hypothetical protein EXR75_12265 [Myxococcales bacterium]|nr:hypothetical protein [Myxococcales bacterium]
MQDSALILVLTAAALGFGHTLIGVDHSLPFVVLAKAERWSLKRLLLVTALCGLAHVLSSALIGTLGVGLGVTLERLQWVESARGGLASVVLIGLGLAYAVWGVYRSMRGANHSHAHAHLDGTLHAHGHHHQSEHAHAHLAVCAAAPALSGAEAVQPAAGPIARAGKAGTLTLIGLFLVFVLGPCEVLIPMLVVPAYQLNWPAVIAVVFAFGLATIGTMLGLVTIGYLGLQHRTMPRLERHLTALTGLSIAATGIAMRAFGL